MGDGCCAAVQACLSRLSMGLDTEAHKRAWLPTKFHLSGSKTISYNLSFLPLAALTVDIMPYWVHYTAAFNQIFKMIVCVSVCMWVSACECMCPRSSEGIGSLETEIQSVVSHLMWLQRA